MTSARDINPKRIEAVRSLAGTAAAALRRARARKEAGLLEEAIQDLGTRRKARWLRGLRLIVGMCHSRYLGDFFPPGMGIEGADWLELLDTLARRCRRLIRELENP